MDHCYTVAAVSFTNPIYNQQSAQYIISSSVSSFTDNMVVPRKVNKKAVLSQGGTRDAAVNFDTY